MPLCLWLLCVINLKCWEVRYFYSSNWLQCGRPSCHLIILIYEPINLFWLQWMVVRRGYSGRALWQISSAKCNSTNCLCWETTYLFEIVWIIAFSIWPYLNPKQWFMYIHMRCDARYSDIFGISFFPSIVATVFLLCFCLQSIQWKKSNQPVQACECSVWSTVWRRRLFIEIRCDCNELDLTPNTPNALDGNLPLSLVLCLTHCTHLSFFLSPVTLAIIGVIRYTSFVSIE